MNTTISHPVGYIDYFAVYDSSSVVWKPILLTVFFLWTLSLFISLGLTAKEFFCSNLATVSSILKLPESVSGVTLAAFGNGAPDLFSTYSAVNGGLISMALGELIGAAFVITLGVVGIISVLKPSKLSRRSFRRDILYLIFALILINIILSTKRFDYAWGIVLFLYYVSYVFVVLFGPALVDACQSLWRLSEDDVQNDHGSNENVNLFADVDGMSPQENQFESHQEEQTSLPLIDTINVSNGIRGDRSIAMRSETQTHRDIIIDEDEFDYEFFMPQLVQRRMSEYARSHSFQRGNSGSSRSSIGLSPGFLSPAATLPQPPPTSSTTNETSTPAQSVTHLFGSTEEDILDMVDPATLAAIHPPKSDMQCIKDVLFPLFCQWRHLNIMGKLYTILTAPIMFFLGLSIPVMKEHHFVKVDGYSLVPQEVIDITTPTNLEAEDESITVKENDNNMTTYLSVEQDHELRLTVIIMKLFICPFAVSFCGQFLIFAPSSSGLISWIVALLCSFILVFMGYVLFSWKGPLVLGRGLSFLGFGVSIMWIYFISNELVSLLDALGRILHVHQTIIGLTIFAFGNSIGDCVANLTIARMGYPSMAIGACYGGPLLNIVLGLGLTRLMLPTTTTTNIPSMGTAFWIINISTLVGLICTFGYSIFFRYVLDARFGYGVLVYMVFVVTVAMMMNG